MHEMHQNTFSGCLRSPRSSSHTGRDYFYGDRWKGLLIRGTEVREERGGKLRGRELRVGEQSEWSRH